MLIFLLVAPLIEELVTLWTSGVKVYDAAALNEREANATIKALLAVLTADYRGLPHITCMQQHPALIGACCQCTQVAVPLLCSPVKTTMPELNSQEGEHSPELRTTIYLGAHRQLPPGHLGRHEWASSFRWHGSLRADSKAPELRSDAELRDMADRVEAHLKDDATPAKIGIKRLGAFAKALPYLDQVLCYNNDSMHAISNAS